MRIIGHRGAAGTELENTLASLQSAIDHGVDIVEFDVRKTRDGRLVVFHDPDLRRVADNPRRVSDLTLRQLQKIPLHSGSHIPTLSEALDVLGNHPCIIELKSSDASQELISVLNEYPKTQFTVASFNLDELAQLRTMAPDYKIYALERTRAFDIIHLAREIGLDGIGFNYWIFNPLTYWLCKRAGLDMYAYTVDHPFQAAFLTRLYPELDICTNYPERLIKKRKLIGPHQNRQ